MIQNETASTPNVGIDQLHLLVAQLRKENKQLKKNDKYKLKYEQLKEENRNLKQQLKVAYTYTNKED